MIINRAYKCPMCGRTPKIKKGKFGRMIVECKPMFGDPHMQIMVKPNLFFGTRAKAIERWDKLVAATDINERMVDAKCVRLERLSTSAVDAATVSMAARHGIVL